jgi:thiazole synthase ThiGH ThiG subunit
MLEVESSALGVVANMPRHAPIAAQTGLTRRSGLTVVEATWKAPAVLPSLIVVRSLIDLPRGVRDPLEHGLQVPRHAP